MSSLTELLEHHSVVLMESTIPADMTIDDWRRRRTRHRSPANRRRLGWSALGQVGGFR